MNDMTETPRVAATFAPVTVDLQCYPVRIEGGRVFLQLAE